MGPFSVVLEWALTGQVGDPTWEIPLWVFVVAGAFLVIGLATLGDKVCAIISDQQLNNPINVVLIGVLVLLACFFCLSSLFCSSSSSGNQTQVMETVGKKITKLSFTSGFAAQYATAFVVVGATLLGLPISTTHTIVGAVTGTALVTTKVGIEDGIVVVD